jgi:pSer/pThr/pTyr-binding forkhead associated (FHA) protein
VEDDQVVLVDLGSTNGTLVNGQPVRRVTLTDGTNVMLGRTTLVFRQDTGHRQDAGYQQDPSYRQDPGYRQDTAY